MTTADRHSTQERLLQAYLRQDFAIYLEKVFRTLEPGTTFSANWHLEHLAWQLMRVERGEVRRLIICVPPRSMKSITVSVAFTAWLMGRDPSKRIICASYADDLARKLSMDTRIVLDSAWHQQLFPKLQLTSKRPRGHELITTTHGYRLALGMGGSILGRGADVIVVDDPIKATDVVSSAERRRVNDAFDSTLYTRLNNKKTGAIVIIMQRLHQDDLVGHVLDKGEWVLVSIPAIAMEDCTYQLSDAPDHVHRRRAGDILHEARESYAELEATRRMQGSLVFSAQYQQEPVQLEGNIVRREWLRSYTTAPSSFDFTLASWDTASTLSDTADYSVGTVWGAKGLDFYLLQVVRGRFEVPDLRQQILATALRYNVNQTVVEGTDIGRAIAQDLRRTGQYQVVLNPPRLDKEARFLAQSARFEAGQVFVPQEAPWLADWLLELLAFPNGRHDDQVDSTSQALHCLSSRMFPLHTARQARQRPSGRDRPAGFHQRSP